MPFIFTLKTLMLIMFTSMFFGFAVAFWMKYPRQYLKWAYYNLRRLSPIPVAFITRDGYLKFDIFPRGKFVNTGSKGFFNQSARGLINLFGFGLGNIFYEGCAVPLDISLFNLEKKVEQLAEKIKKETEKMGARIPLDVAFRSVNPDELESLWFAWGMWAYDTFRAKAERVTKLGTWLILGMVFLVLGLTIAIMLKQNQIVAVLKDILLVMKGHAKTGIVTK